MWIIELLTTEALVKKTAYWKEIWKECQLEEGPEPNDDMTLDVLIELNLERFREKLEEVAKKAEKQWGIEKKLNEITEKLKEIKLDIIEYKNSGTYVLKGVDDIQQFLDDQMNILMMMKASPFIRGVIKKANDLESKLIMLQDTLEEWIKVQRGWIYLEPIFSSEDIKQKLETEKLKFDGVDKFWRSSMEFFFKEPNIYDSIDSEKIKQEFHINNKILESVQKSLSEYLETKRRFFPRFYFLSDDQLLEILAQTKDPETVQRHINKCFEAINLLKFNSKQEVTAMISPEKEVVEFVRTIDVNEGDKRGNVEKWLIEIEEVMKETLKSITQNAFKDNSTQRTKWVLKYPAQVVLAVNMIRWTFGAETALKEMKDTPDALNKYQDFLKNQIRDIVDLVRGDLNELERMTLGALVVLDVHAKDIITELTDKRTDNIHEFTWLKHMRYYWETNPKGSHLKVRMVNAENVYGFEYLGNSSRLVITSLTDRCYRTLLGAFHLFYGGAPEGPAGTGKTESVKDLAKAVAMQCVVFNCSDGLNYSAMSKFFKGLASSGAWCCFDEFNRIELEVLSVIAQQVVSIQNAIRDKNRRFFFEDEDISLVATCTINITMNPGYAGRSVLPDNLKALFRSCAMMVPEYGMIAEIFLYSLGFQEARDLSRKIVASLRLSSEQLSSQYHYDFGMRALKAILTAAGDLKRKMVNDSEDIIAMRALLDVNIPKFTRSDIPLFMSIASDLFPKVEMPERDYGSLQRALKAVCEELNYIPNPDFLKKSIELYDTILVRHGLMIVGEAFSGKSATVDILRRAMTSLHGKEDFFKVQTFSMNPKSIQSFQLYGLFDRDTKSWSDGVLPIIMRHCYEDSEVQERKWVVFDGPVDAVWIESMNTVLDDNKKLCLTSGETIKMTRWMTMMFEVEDLQHASPATVSRCGMVFLETKSLGWKTLVEAFPLKHVSDSLKLRAKEVIGVLNHYLAPSIAFVKKYGAFPVTFSEMNVTNSALNIFKTFTDIYMDEKVKVPNEIEDIMANFALFSIVWSVGIILEESVREKFTAFVSSLVKNEKVFEKFQLESDLPEISTRAFNVMIPEFNSIFEMCFVKEKQSWQNWMQMIPAYKIQKEALYHQLVIPTIDSVRNNLMLRLLVSNSKHVMITGPTGTGKTLNVISELNTTFFNETYTNFCTAFSGQTSVNQVQKMIEGKMSTKRRKGCFGPEDRKQKIVIFIDDVNMPTKETYMAQPPIELLRQWMDFGGWFDLETKEFKYLQDMIFVIAMSPPSVGRNSITNRYMRHFNIIYAEPFDKFSLTRIFTNLLEWFYLNGDYSKSIINLRDKVVGSTIELYNTIRTSKKLLPIPAKSHYKYNLRDIWKVFQGISQGNNKSLREDSDFIKLWVHECMRVFHDRLISLEDQDYFVDIVKDIVKSNFRKEWDDLIQVKPMLWASFVPTVHPDNDPSKKPYSNVYCELVDHEKLRKKTEEFLLEYNNCFTSNRMNLVLFMNALQHVIRIVRILSTAYGHSLLLGVGGSGRKSLATLSSFILEFELYVPDSKSWEEEIQKVLRMAGVDSKTMVFMFSDYQILQESMVEDICSLLNNGEVPGLFPLEEKMKIIEDISSEAPSGTNNQKWAFFVDRCKTNLHLIICMSPVGEKFRKRLRTFPGLVNYTTIDWFLPWPEDALVSTAEISMKETQLSPELQKGCVGLFVDMQMRISKLSIRYFQELRRYNYVTPTSYLELLAIFKFLAKKRSGDIQEQIKRYSNGVEMIESADKNVQEMQKVLEDLGPKLEVMTKKNKEMLTVLTEKRADAEKKKNICQEEERVTNLQREAANKLRNECQEELDQVLPILDNAILSLEKITKDDITKIKSMVIPPEALKIVFEALCIAIGEDANVKWVPKEPGSLEKIQNFWDHSKRFVLNDKLIKKLKAFKEDAIKAIPRNKIQKLKGLIENPEFTQERISNASEAASRLAEWTRAIVSTYDALLIVDPKRKELEEAESQLAEKETLLKEKIAALQNVLDLLQSLENDYSQACKERDELYAQVDLCEKQLERAKRLISLLAGERESWTRKSKLYKEESKSVVGDVILSSGFIAYLGNFPAVYREECVKAWEELLTKNSILFSNDFSLQKTLSDPIEIGKLVNNSKLPNDDVSIENAIILKNSSRWPLMIDPQLQANIWIKEMEKATGKLVILKQTDKQSDIVFKLENSITLGTPVLLENIGEDIDSVFESVLLKKLVKSGGSYKLKFGEKLLDYSNDFRFYVTTKLSKPHYSPEICVKVTLLNFTVTLEGLEDQMLNIFVKIEEPRKEEQRQNNIREFFENKLKQKKTEDMILQLLNENQDRLLEDDEMIKILQTSKAEGQEIEERLRKQEMDREHFNNIRNFYREIAKRASNLYFVVMDLVNIEPVYQFSLESFIELFEKAVSLTPEGKDLRVKNVNSKFTAMLYDYVLRSLLEKDKLIFSFLICLKILQMEKKAISSQEIRFLMLGGSLTEISKPNPAPSWLSNKSWMAINELASVNPVYKGFESDFESLLPEWEKVYASTDPHIPEKSNWPKKWAENLTQFQQLLFLRVFRTDKTIEAVQNLIGDELGEKFIEPPPFNLQSAYDDSSFNTPLIFVLSTGADPRLELMGLAEKLNFKNRLAFKSLGQGQAEAAEAAIKNALEKGEWICLQNCHLCVSWMPSLERIVENIPVNTNQDFRLWLTTMPSETFPVSILQKGVKITYEPPKGLKNNLMRSYNALDPKKYDQCEKPFEFKKLLFGLSFFHALVLERRKFGPLGWNIPYEFSSADLAISQSQLKLFLNDYEEIQWEALNYMVAQANYGGRVTDDKDRRLIEIILNDFYSPKILDENYKFSKSGIYFAPEDSPLENYKEYIRNLPINDGPEVFGLHENAEISSLIQDTNKLCLTILSLLPRATGSSSNPDTIIKEKCETILKKLPLPFDLEAVEKKNPMKYTESMNIVLIMEIQRYNKLLIVIDSRLKLLVKAVDGIISMTNDLEEDYNKIFDNLVPESWMKHSYPSLKPLSSYISDFLERLKFLQKWIDEGSPASFWISGFYFTQAFLTGTLQSYARKFNFKFVSKKSGIDVTKHPEDGCYVHGLYLDGAMWNDEEEVLGEQLPRVLYSEVPHVYLFPVVDKKEVERKKDIYDCPVYTTSSRRGELKTTGHSTNFVMSMDVPISEFHSREHWVKRGVAMITQLND